MTIYLQMNPANADSEPGCHGFVGAIMRRNIGIYSRAICKEGSTKIYYKTEGNYVDVYINMTETFAYPEGTLVYITTNQPQYANNLKVKKVEGVDTSKMSYITV
jgi:hypothetical protein